MTGLPDLIVTLDDGSGTWPHDVTAYVRMVDGIGITRGRSDEFADIQPSQASLNLDNADGRFTVGDPTYGFALDQPIRISYGLPGGVNRNYLTANQASVETSVSDWGFNTAFGVYDLGTSLTQSATRAQDGTYSMLATVPASAKGTSAVTLVPLTAGVVYTYSVWVYVPSGSPDVRAEVTFVASGPWVTAKDAWQRASVTFTASATNFVAVTSKAGGAGTWYADTAMVNTGSVPGEYNTVPYTILDRFTGTIDSIPAAWPTGGDEYAVTAITATDQTPGWSRLKLRSLLAEEILADSPTHYWPLDDAEGSTVADDVAATSTPSPMRQLGSGVDVAFGNEHGPATDESTAAVFAGKHAGATPAVLIGADWTVECLAYINCTDVAAFTANIWLAQDVLTNDYLLLSYDSVTDNLMVSAWDDSTATLVNSGLFGVPTNLALHHVAATLTGGILSVYVDGALVDSDAVGWWTGGTCWLHLGTVSGDGALDLSQVAVYDHALTADRIADHAGAALTGIPETSDARLTRYLGYAGLAPADLALEAGVQTVAHLDITGTSVTEAVAAVARAEGGLVLIGGDGSVVMQSRTHRVAQLDPVAVLAAADLDGDAQVVTDMALVRNTVTYTATTGRPQQVVDDTSVYDHGVYDDSGDLLVASAEDALSAADWMVANYAEPQPRLPDVAVDLLTAPASVQSAVAGLEVSDRVQVTGLPSQAPDGTLDLYVEGVSESLSAAGWSVALNLSNDTGHVWTLSDAIYSVLGTSTRLFY